MSNTTKAKSNNKTKSIQLCAIGNGIVDIQHRVSEELFKNFDLPKGEMRLVEPSFQIDIIKKIYENTKNLSPNKCSGGSATNTIDAFAQFGGTAAYLTAVGDDENGNFYYKELDDFSINYKKNVIPNTPTGVCLVLITPDGERTMLTSLAASKQFSSEHIDKELIAKAEWLYIEGYKFSETFGVEAISKSIEIAKEHKTKIAISASDLFVIDIFGEQLMQALKQADLLFCNENEANAIAKKINPKSNIDSDNCDKLIEIIRKSCKNIIITQGGSGSKVLFKGNIFDFEAFPTRVVDTTGAGDMFAGAFLFGMMNGGKLLASNELNDIINFSGKLASKASSIIVSQLGARYKGSFQSIIDAILSSK